MEVELFSYGVSEEDTVEVDAENDYFGESERCGICMDVVVDRGVLDCCQHWFCFVCIDNWASITNLCPLCQNEFQLITCIPLVVLMCSKGQSSNENLFVKSQVYDTIGGNKTDENSDLSDNDWCVEGKNNTLSFPSYYIDENAVTCLDGDGCKIRGGSVTNEETLTLDTSIACDSCDLWYHAFCVGFDPEGADVDSWLCPRCLVSETHQDSAFKGTYLLQNQIDSESADHSCLVDTSSGKVSISVADDGETAVVVSRIGGENFVEEPIANGIPTQELTNHCETEMSVLGPDSCSSELKQNSLDQGIKATQLEATTPVRLHVSLDESEPIGSDSGLCLDPGSSLDATLSEEEKTKVLSGDDKCPQGASGKNTSTDETSEDVKADLAPKVGTKRKCTDYSFLTNDEDKSDEVQLGSGLTRKVKSHPCASLNEPAHISAPEDHQNTNNWVESSVDEMGRNVTAKKPLPIDIMSIVRDKEPKTTKKLTRQKETDKCPKVQQNAARLRVKKIMRRSSEDQKAADVVQELRKEIREAVQKRPSDDMGKNIFDPNLLTAFRAAVTGSAAAPVKKAPMKAKKLVLQKGKTRENLTKKIYATSSGKRRRAWDRDCQVEFWKHRCMTTSKPEKIETLRSVLNLLKRSPETKQVEQDSEEEANAPILSRLYLADASVFPRKDDIKPLSVLKAAAGSKQNEEPSSGEKDAKASQDHSNVGRPNSNEFLTLGTVAADDKNIENTCNHNNGFASAKAHSDKQSVRSSSQNTTACKTDMKLDKRKWAMAVLARKTASNSSSSVHQKQDNAVFSGNYPLLAELPADMRPELAPIRHNKIPVSVRQAQLYRLTEHFLKMSNLSSIHRTAATELAVADAINIEKQVAERANSKVVYMNLCSQEVRHRTMCHSSRTPVESKPSSPLPVPDEGGEPSKSSLDSEGGQPSKLSLDSEALEALRNAGLLSDSPPCSPDHYVKDAHDNGNPDVEVDEEGMKDIFEMDSQPDLDIYGDFEYDLDEEFYTDASAIKASKSQATDGESKMKVVFSTLTSNKTDWSVEGKEGDLLEAEQLSNTSKLLGSCNDTGIGSSATDNNDPSADIEDEELSIRECEELYGPDKEPLVNKFSAVLSSENSAPQSVDNEEVKNPEENNLVSTSCKVVADGGKSSSSSRAVENAHDKKNGDSKVDKKSGHVDSVQKKVEAYIKEHIRPLCKSGVITVEQYRWAVGKTTDKVMKYHSKAKNANFLIKEGEKVKKLAEQYVEAANHKENK